MKAVIGYFIIMLVGAGLMSGCGKWKLKIPTPPVFEDQADTTGPVVPSALTNPVVKSQYGSAVIHFDVPDAENTSYILAEYTLNDGTVKSVHASKFADSIEVDGFNDNNTYEIKLYAVGPGDKRSDPLVVAVTPLLLPFKGNIESVKIVPVISGIQISFTNNAETNLEITTKEKDNGSSVTLDHRFSSDKHVEFVLQGMEIKETNIELNITETVSYTDTVVLDTLTPINGGEYIDINTSNYQKIVLPSDVLQYSGSWAMMNLFDGNPAPNDYISGSSGMPQYFTVDLLDTYKLVRFDFWTRLQSGYYYDKTAVKDFKVWGTGEETPHDDLNDGTWHLLGAFEVVKPSGEGGDITQGDIDAANAGFKFIFDNPPTIPVRYIRFQTINTFGGSDHVTIGQLKFYGIKQ